MKNQDQPAFPIPHPEMTIKGQSVTETQGMTLRQWFAGMALQGILASGARDLALSKVVEESIKATDEMIKQLSEDVASTK